MAKQEGWRRGVGPYSGGVKLTTPPPPPSMRASNRGSGSYSRSDLPMSHPSAETTAGNTRAKTGNMPDGSRQIDVEGASRNSGYAARVPKK
jgi:hypothetical protein